MLRLLPKALLAALLLRGTWGINFETTIEEYCGYYDIEVERHSVLTEDGYMLVTHRLPRRGAPVVMLYHGVMASSWCWLANSPRLSAAFELYKGGYDVWLPNSRGNLYSRHHKWLNSSRDTEFWNFTLVDFARYDMPANIDHTLAVTGRDTLSFIAHSEAAYAFFLANGMQPSAQRLAGKVNLCVALGPVAYLGHQRSPLFTGLAQSGVYGPISLAFPLGTPTLEHFRDFLLSICTLTGQTNCKMAFGMFGGPSELDTFESIKNQTAHYPAGTSTKSCLYYAQLFKSGVVEDFDYGAEGNTRHYGRRRPPKLAMGGFDTPTALFFGGNDYYTSPVDIDRLRADFSKGNVVHSMVYEGFSHLTWISGNAESFRKWWPQVRHYLQVYNPVHGHAKPIPGSFLARARIPGPAARDT